MTELIKVCLKSLLHVFKFFKFLLFEMLLLCICMIVQRNKFFKVKNQKTRFCFR